MSSLSNYVFKIAKDLSQQDPIYSESLLLSAVFSTGPILKNSFYIDNFLNSQPKISKIANAKSDAKQAEGMIFEPAIRDACQFFYVHLSKGKSADGSKILEAYKKMMTNNKTYALLEEKLEEKKDLLKSDLSELKKDILSRLLDAEGKISKLVPLKEVDLDTLHSESKNILQETLNDMLGNSGLREALTDNDPSEEKKLQREVDTKCDSLLSKYKSKKGYFSGIESFVEYLRSSLKDKVEERSDNLSPEKILSPVLAAGLKETRRIVDSKYSALRNFMKQTSLVNLPLAQCEELFRKLVIHVPAKFREKEERSIQAEIQKVLQMKGFSRSSSDLQEIVYDIIGDTLLLDNRLEHSFINAALKSIRGGERVCIKTKGNKEESKFNFLYHDTSSNTYTVNLSGFLVNRLMDVYSEYSRAKSTGTSMKPNAFKMSAEAKSKLRNTLVKEFSASLGVDNSIGKKEHDRIVKVYSKLISILSKTNFQREFRALKKEDPTAFNLILQNDKHLRLYGEESISPLKKEIDGIEKREVGRVDTLSFEAPVYDDEGTEDTLYSKVEGEESQEDYEEAEIQYQEDLLTSDINNLVSTSSSKLSPIKKMFLNVKINHFKDPKNHRHYAQLLRKYFGENIGERDPIPLKVLFIQNYIVDNTVRASILKLTGKKISDKSIDDLYSFLLSMVQKRGGEDFQLFDPVLNKLRVNIDNNYPMSGGVGTATLDWLDTALHKPMIDHDIDTKNYKNLPSEFSVDDAKTIIAESYISSVLSFLDTGNATSENMHLAEDKLGIFIHGDPKRETGVLSKYFPEDFFDKYKNISRKMDPVYFYLLQDLYEDSCLAIRKEDEVANVREIDRYAYSKEKLLEAIKFYADDIEQTHRLQGRKNEKTIAALMFDTVEETVLKESDSSFETVEDESKAYQIAKKYYELLNLDIAERRKSEVSATLKRIALLLTHINFGRVKESANLEIAGINYQKDYLKGKVGLNNPSEHLKKQILGVLGEAILNTKRYLKPLNSMNDLRSTIENTRYSLDTEVRALKGKNSVDSEYEKDLILKLEAMFSNLRSKLNNFTALTDLEDEERFDSYFSYPVSSIDINYDGLVKIRNKLAKDAKEVLSSIASEEREFKQNELGLSLEIQELREELIIRFNNEIGLYKICESYIKDRIFSYEDITEENRKKLYAYIKEYVDSLFSGSFKTNVLLPANWDSAVTREDLIRRRISKLSKQNVIKPKDTSGIDEIVFELLKSKGIIIPSSLLSNNELIKDIIDPLFVSAGESTSANKIKEIISSKITEKLKNSFPPISLTDKNYSDNTEGALYSLKSSLCRSMLIKSVNLSDKDWEKEETRRLNKLIDQHIYDSSKSIEKVEYMSYMKKPPAEREDFEKKKIFSFRRKVLPLRETISYNRAIRDLLIKKAKEKM